MAPVNLSRLRPQISALSSQFTDEKRYIKSLKTLLDQYSNDIDIAAAGIRPHSLIPKLNVPSVVIQQLEISYRFLASQFPDNSIRLAETLWKLKYFEYKHLALILLSRLPESHTDTFFENLRLWVDEDLEEPIMDVIISIAQTENVIINHPAWIEIVQYWLSSPAVRVKKFGLRGIAEFITTNSDNSLPFVFRQISPIFSDPILSIQKELLRILEILISKSANETAAFLINIGTLYPGNTMFGFIRKSLSLFPDNLARNISNSLPE